mmetsp:Transcript_31077/g.53129  ORF Transcript_31077/g.53129 Transcript_31077/m.53129 type:complete len:125 (+) Transcript_31077:478-852(+)
MGSLHARRPPKLKQGDLRRKRQQRNPSQSPINGGGSLRRPPNGAGVEISMGGGGNSSNSSKRRFCSAKRMIILILTLIFLSFLYVQARKYILGESSVKGIVPGLRANQNVESVGSNTSEGQKEA